MQEAQHQLGAAVAQPHDQLAARAAFDAALGDDAFDLRDRAVAQRGDRAEAGFVLVAHRQVQGQVDVAAQAKLFHGARRPRR